MEKVLQKKQNYAKGIASILCLDNLGNKLRLDGQELYHLRFGLVPLVKSGSCLFIFTTTYDDNNGS
jgi:hypothetical protein